MRGGGEEMKEELVITRQDCVYLFYIGFLLLDTLIDSNKLKLISRYTFETVQKLIVCSRQAACVYHI